VQDEEIIVVNKPSGLAVQVGPFAMSGKPLTLKGLKGQKGS